jgi:hypothetical protein
MMRKNFFCTPWAFVSSMPSGLEYGGARNSDTQGHWRRMYTDSGDGMRILGECLIRRTDRRLDSRMSDSITLQSHRQ